MDDVRAEVEGEKKRTEKEIVSLKKKIQKLERQRLNKLLKDQESTKLTLPDIAKLTNLDRLDRELVLLLIKHINVSENGKVAITYNFAE
jgi:hypothetical protein